MNIHELFFLICGISNQFKTSKFLRNLLHINNLYKTVRNNFFKFENFMLISNLKKMDLNTSQRQSF